jgi:anti-sigma factor RsiW
MTHPLRLLAAHALGALPAADGEALERHLAGCAACRAEACDLFEAAAWLALALPPVEPPPTLRGRVMAEIPAAAP